jgi:hypothetical protein
VDPRIVDPSGEKTVVALAAAPPGTSLPYDDPAVTGAFRSALSSEPASVCSTLMTADGGYAGILVAPPHLATPFATIFPMRTLTVGPGVLKPAPWPTGPGTQRYGSTNPWPVETKL